MGVSPPEGVVPGTRPDSADKARTLRLVRRKMEKRRFRIAFVLALLFHLSMVTVFEIVIPFPRHDMAYFNVSLVASPTATATADNRTGDLLTLGGDPFLMAGLPPVDLPVVEFAEIDRLRIRYDACRIWMASLNRRTPQTVGLGLAANCTGSGVRFANLPFPAMKTHAPILFPNHSAPFHTDPRRDSRPI